jgi:hypothetical protein
LCVVDEERDRHRGRRGRDAQDFARDAVLPYYEITRSEIENRLVRTGLERRGVEDALARLLGVDDILAEGQNGDDNASDEGT